MSNQLKEANLSLTKEQWSIMAVLWKEDGCTQQVLADATYRDRPGVTRLLDNLQKEGFVERRPSPESRRVNLIYLTKKGKSIEGNVVATLNKIIKTITKGIKKEQIENLRTTLNLISKNIQEIESK